jgi:hypothetical protein
MANMQGEPQRFDCVWTLRRAHVSLSQQSRASAAGSDTASISGMRHLLHTVLLALFLVLSTYSVNLGQVGLSDILPGLAFVLATAAVLLVLTWPVMGNLAKAALTTSLILFLFFMAGHFVEVAHNLQAALPVAPLADNLLYSAWILIMALPVLIVRRTKRAIEGWSTGLNVIAASLVIVPLVTIAYETRNEARPSPGPQDTDEPLVLESPRDGAVRPDIYFLVFDRYTNNQILTRHFDFDNAEFLSTLERAGFYIASDSSSNYLRTAHSLASSLNLTYLDDIAAQYGSDSRDYRPLFVRIRFPKIARILKAQGYTHHHFGSWWDPTSRSPIADRNFDVFSVSDFVVLLYKQSILYPLDDAFGLFLLADAAQCRRVPLKFAALKALAQEDGPPRFVFAHFLLPHAPYIFDASGRCVADGDFSETSYLAQLSFANREIHQLVAAILANGERESVILLQSDEGPYPPRYADDHLGFDWRTATPEELRIKTGILNAIRLPADGTADGPADGVESLYPQISPVNTLRFVLRRVFGADIKLLPDRTYIHRDEDHIYDFTDVTDLLRERE